MAWWPGSGSSLDVDAEPLADRRDLVIATHLEDQRASSLEIDAQVDGLVSMVPSPKAATEWNRGPLEPLAKHPLDDKRVRVGVGDVALLLRE